MDDGKDGVAPPRGMNGATGRRAECELDRPDEGDCGGFGELADCERPVTFPLKSLGQQL